MAKAAATKPTRILTKFEVGALKFKMDGSEVDAFIERMERSIAAFKAEWNRKK